MKVFYIRHLSFIAKGEEKELEEESEQEAAGSIGEKSRSQMPSFPRASFSEPHILGVSKQKDLVSSLLCRPTVQSQGKWQGHTPSEVLGEGKDPSSVLLVSDNYYQSTIFLDEWQCDSIFCPCLLIAMSPCLLSKSFYCYEYTPYWCYGSSKSTMT